MTRTDWSGGAAVPQMATGITTVGADFEHLLTGLLSYSGLPKAARLNHIRFFSAIVVPMMSRNAPEMEVRCQSKAKG